MYKKGGSIAEKSNEPIVKTLLNLTSKVFPILKAHAEENEPEGNSIEEPTGGEGTKPKSSPINYEDLITKARSEEKQKQYKKVERLQGLVDASTEQHNTDLLRIASLEKELKEAKETLTTAGQGDSEAIKALKGTVETLENEKKELEKKLTENEKNKLVSREEVEKEIRAELEEEYKVKTHRAELIAKHTEDLYIPELVTGSTIEELDASLEAALARSKEIADKFSGSKKGDGGNQKRTPKTPNNPSVDKTQDKGYSLEYLASLDPASSEYKEVRKSLGLK